MTTPTLDAVIEGMAEDIRDEPAGQLHMAYAALRSPALQAVLREGASALQNALPHLPTAGSDYVKGAAALAKLWELIEK